MNIDMWAGLPFPTPLPWLPSDGQGQDHLHILALLETLSESADTGNGSMK